MRAYDTRERNLITLCSIEDGNYNVWRAATENFICDVDLEKREENLIKCLTRGVYNKVKALYADGAYREKLFAALEKRGIECVTIFSEDYPAALREINAPPAVLYCKGNVKLLGTRCFAVVGSRRTPAFAITACKNAARELTQHFTVVTGLADGADTAAAEGALESGKLISVLANGLDYVYPAVNKRLAERIEEKGLLISEYFYDVPPRKYNFPVRNRIIAGLSRGTLVVSAPERSGALITADYSLEYGREVFAFPYNVGVAAGAGCNALIKDGANLARNTLDIFSVFGLDLKARGDAALSDEEEAVLKIIREEGEAFAPAVAEKLGKPPFKIIPLLTSLEIKGKITRLGGNRYSAT